MNFFGLISYINIDMKLIGIMRHRRMHFFYLQNRLIKLFKRYLYIGNYISLVYDGESSELRDKVYAYQILYITKLFVPGKYRPDVFYDKNIINNSLVEFLENLNNLLFIDFEMTMPNYDNNKNSSFKPEIIQAAFLLVSNDIIIEKHNFYIKPTHAKYLNARTKDFLSISAKEVTKGISYKEFYNFIKKIIENYNPAIIVWGKNDIICLNNSYIINKLPSLSNNSRFIDLNALIKNYYEMKSDPGLFKMYQFYNKEFEKEQLHNALEDALITYKVFEAFKADVKSERGFLKESSE